MAIRGLTDREASFPQIGVIHKGDVKGERGPGRDLTWFRFDSKDTEATQAFYAAYGPEPTAFNAFVPYSSTEKNFEAWQEEWTASSLRHRCDGKYVTILLLPNGKYKIPEPGERILCPGNCRPVGRLKVIIPELKRFASVSLQTTSVHDISEITSNLRAIEDARGSLLGVPLIVRRVVREITVPGKDGAKRRRPASLVHIEARPDWVQKQLAAMAEAALPPAAAPYEALALPSWSGAVIEEDEEGDAVSAPVIDHKALEDEIKRFCMDLFDHNKAAAKKFFESEYGDLDYEARQEKFAQHQDKGWWIQAINDAMGEAAAQGVSQDAIGRAVDDNGGWGFDDLSLSSLRKICTAIGYTKEA